MLGTLEVDLVPPADAARRALGWLRPGSDLVGLGGCLSHRQEAEAQGGALAVSQMAWAGSRLPLSLPHLTASPASARPHAGRGRWPPPHPLAFLGGCSLPAGTASNPRPRPACSPSTGPSVQGSSPAPAPCTLMSESHTVVSPLLSGRAERVPGTLRPKEGEKALC